MKALRQYTTHENAEIALLAAKEQAEKVSAELSTYLEAIGQLALVSVTDHAGRILQVNNKFCQISGYSQHELIGQNHNILNSGIHSKEFFTEMWRTIADGKTWHDEICNRNKTGKLYWLGVCRIGKSARQVLRKHFNCVSSKLIQYL